MGTAIPSPHGELKASNLMPSSMPTPVSADRIAAAIPPKPAAAVRPPAPGENNQPKFSDDMQKPLAKQLEDRLNNLATDPNTPSVRKPADKPKPAEAAPAAAKPATEAEGEEGAEAVDLSDPNAATPPAATPPPIDKKKTNPWKLIDEHKKARATLEAEVADLKKIVANPEMRKQEVDRLTAAEKRNQELEETIKFVDYSKSKEFAEQYTKPYEAAWGRAMAELKELTIADPNTGDVRAMAPADLLELVNMPLLKAREVADELYGAAANEVMAYRKEIKGLYEKQAMALTEAKTAGVEKSKADTAKREAQMQAVQAETSKHWEDVNKAILSNETTGKYFKPVEGNEDINKRLDAGYKFVDETMALNPLNPNLTSEQRQDAIKRHASLRHRAAAFGRMRLELETTQKEAAELRTRLAQFEGTVPSFGGDAAPATEVPAGGNRMSAMMTRLGQRAKG